MITTKHKNIYQIQNINKYDLINYTNHKINDINSRAIIIIPNLCNTNYTYGGVISNKIAAAYPIVEQSYNVLGKIFVHQHPGHTQFIEVTKNKSNKLFVANMIAQTGVSHKPQHRTINYAYLVESMNQIKAFICQQKIKYNDEHFDISIHSYKFGTGKGCNGDWNFITNLLSDILVPHCNIYIYNK